MTLWSGGKPLQKLSFCIKNQNPICGAKKKSTVLFNAGRARGQLIICKVLRLDDNLIESG